MTIPRPALLFLCQTLPFPPDGGVNIRTFNVLKQLARAYDIHAVFFYRKRATPDVARSVAGIRPYVQSVEAFPIEQEHSRARLLRDHLVSTVSRAVYTRPAYDNRDVHARLQALLAEREYAVVHCDSLDLSGYLPQLTSAPVVCVHHNVESILLRRRAAVQTNPAKRHYLAFQANLMEREEAEWCPRVALNAVCSPDDGAALQQIAPGARVAVVPNGVDIDTFQPGPTLGSGVVFVGGMTWFPNLDGMEWFAADIAPKLRALGHSDPVTWVGRAAADQTAAWAKRGVKLTGYVDDIRPIVHGARCFIVPLRVGGGTRLKVLDAWAMGKGVVSTSVGCEGLDARDGWNILIRDDPAEFAAAVQLVLTDDALATRLGVNARTTVEQTYSWEGIGIAMRDEYEAVVAGAGVSAGTQ